MNFFAVFLLPNYCFCIKMTKHIDFILAQERTRDELKVRKKTIKTTIQDKIIFIQV